MNLSLIKAVLVCEAQPFTQLGLEFAIKEILPNIDFVAKVSSPREAINIATSIVPELTLISLYPHFTRSFDVIVSLKELKPMMQIIVLVDTEDASFLKEIASLNVSAIIQKTFSEKHLRAAIENIQRLIPKIYFDKYTESLVSNESEEIVASEFRVKK